MFLLLDKALQQDFAVQDTIVLEKALLLLNMRVQLGLLD